MSKPAPLWVPCPKLTEPYSPEYITASIDLLKQTLTAIGDAAKPLAGLVAARFPQYAAESRRAAEVVGSPVEDLILAELSYDLMVAFGCSTMALATKDGPILARNMDWAPEQSIARASCVTDLPDGERAGFVGQVGVVTGLSRKGFALALNAVGCDAPELSGWPMLLFLRHVLDTATEFESALKILTEEPVASAGLVTLIGTENDQRAVIERSGTRVEVRRPIAEEPLMVTNHFRQLGEPDALCDRYRRLSELVPTLNASPSDEELLYALTDGRVRQTITAQHVIMRPWEGTLRLYVPSALLK